MANEPLIVWESAALVELQKALCSLHPETQSKRMNEHVRMANRILGKTFPESLVVVKNRLAGFRVKVDLDILMVQVLPSPSWDRLVPEQLRALVPEELVTRLDLDPACYIVKLDHGEHGESCLAREWKAWLECRPAGMRTDNLLTSLRPGFYDSDNKRLKSLIYNDGHAVLGTGEIVSLEQAVIHACRYGSPSIGSLELGIHRLLNRLNGRFYGQSYTLEDPSWPLRSPVEEQPEHRLHRRLTTSLDRWRDSLNEASARRPTGGITDAEHRRHRREALALLVKQRDSFIDPCDYLQDLLERPDECPRLLHGCSHGDLHGRNILVSLVDEEVGSFVLYDYDEMRPDNVVGWDFVKLETELKVRVFAKIFSPNFRDFVAAAHRFEERLAQLTDAFHTHGRIDRRLVADLTRPERRLMRLIMAIRTRAKQHLGVLRGRNQEWLEEYYFLLCCYGVYVARFPYGKNELLGAYISAGVAARRAYLPWQLRHRQKQQAERAAQAWLAKEPPTTKETAWREFEASRKLELWGRTSYHGCLDFIRVWSRADLTEPKRPFVEAARFVLEKLCEAYPHVVEFDEELTLVLRELGEDEAAEEVLQRLKRRYYQMNEESLCRFGAYFKKRAHEAWRFEFTEMPDEVRGSFKAALDFYQQAFDLRFDYYPGINVASLHLLMDERTEAAEMAETVLKSIPVDGADPIWRAATRGEAELICGQHEKAADHYRLAVGYRDCDAHARRAMRDQVELLRRVMDEQGQSFWTEERLAELFRPANVRGSAPESPPEIDDDDAELEGSRA